MKKDIERILLNYTEVYKGEKGLIQVIPNGYIEDIAEEIVKLCNLQNVRESIPIHDIRNKLSPVCNLIAMIQSDEMVDKYIPEEIEKCKKSINYLADREVYSL